MANERSTRVEVAAAGTAVRPRSRIGALAIRLSSLLALLMISSTTSATLLDSTTRAQAPQRLAAGQNHTCAIDNGDVRCWGDNAFGQLGYGHTEAIGDDEQPADAGPIDLGGRAVSVGAGAKHTCALLADGTVRCWGRAAVGALGYGAGDNIGDDEDPADAGPVDLGLPATALAVGANHNCALLIGGSVTCWGGSLGGALGYGTRSIGSNNPPSSGGMVDINGEAIAIAAGNVHTCILHANGGVRCWGVGAGGRLGNGSTESIGDDEPPTAAGLVDLDGRAIAITAGGAHTCALLSNGKVRCWGFAANNRLALYPEDRDTAGAALGDDESPTAVPPIDLRGRATAIVAGDAHTCARMSTGAVKCWGYDGDGGLGYGGTGYYDGLPLIELPNGTKRYPLRLGSDSDVAPPGYARDWLDREAIELAAGGGHTCARLDNGTVRCWGRNDHGQLGYGHTRNIGDDEKPAAAGPVVLGNTPEVRAVSVGSRHSCALISDGTVRCWGDNDFGQLGYGHTEAIGDDADEVPHSAGAVDLGREAVAVGAGAAHSCALLDNGGVRCWGRNDRGQLGYGHTRTTGDDEGEVPDADDPVDLGGNLGDRPAVALSVGNHHSCAVLEDGRVRCWGVGWDGRLGYGNTRWIGNDERPASIGPVKLGAEAVAITAGGAHTCATIDNGQVRCWGRGGRLGYGHTRNIGDNEHPASAGNVHLGGDQTLSISIGSNWRSRHTCATLDFGLVRCWGPNAQGQLGLPYPFFPETVGDDEHPRDLPSVGERRLATAASAGGHHSCVLLDIGRVRCWGTAKNGRLGHGGRLYGAIAGDHEHPGELDLLQLGGEAVMLDSNHGHNCAVLADGTLRCWGDGGQGRLGHGNNDNIGDDEHPASAGPVPLLPAL